MNPFAVCIFAIAATCIIATFKSLNPQLSAVAAAVSVVLIFIYLLKGISPFVGFLKSISEENGMWGYFSLMLKAVAISLSCRMSAEICRNCGENALASGVELAGKFGIVIISLPLVKQLLDIAKDMIQ